MSTSCLAGSHYIVPAGLEHTEICLPVPPKIGIKGTHHHTQLKLRLFSETEPRYPVLITCTIVQAIITLAHIKTKNRYNHFLSPQGLWVRHLGRVQLEGLN